MSVARDTVLFPRQTSVKLSFPQGVTVEVVTTKASKNYQRVVVTSLADEKNAQTKSTVLEQTSCVHALAKTPKQDGFVSFSLRTELVPTVVNPDTNRYVREGTGVYLMSAYLGQREAPPAYRTMCVVQAWDAASLTVAKQFQFQFDPRLIQPYAIESLQITPDGKHVVGVLSYWNPSDHSKKATMLSSVFSVCLATKEPRIFTKIPNNLNITSLTLLSENRLALLTNKQGLKLYHYIVNDNLFLLNLFYPPRAAESMFPCLDKRFPYDLVEMNGGSVWCINYENSEVVYWDVSHEGTQLARKKPTDVSEEKQSEFSLMHKSLGLSVSGISAELRMHVYFLLNQLLVECQALEVEYERMRKAAPRVTYVNVHMGAVPVDFEARLIALRAEIKNKKQGISALQCVVENLFRQQQKNPQACLVQVKQQFKNVDNASISRRVYNLFKLLEAAVLPKSTTLSAKQRSALLRYSLMGTLKPALSDQKHVHRESSSHDSAAAVVPPQQQAPVPLQASEVINIVVTDENYFGASGPVLK